MKKSCIIALLQILTLTTIAQSYVDPLQIRYTNAFRSGNNSRGTPFTHIWIGSDIPISLKNNSYLLISPYYENWQIDSASTKNYFPDVSSYALPIGVILALKNNKWMISLTAINRWNGEKSFGKNTYQFGGAGFLSYEKSKGQKLRFGAYVNNEFFGLFVMPLVGADWKIDERNYVFGLLPGRFTWEHKFGNSFYGGATFRAITNSYKLNNGQYLRIDDNQLSLYVDAYPVKRICLTLEPGYGILRKIRTGIDDKNYMTKGKWGDGFFIKLSASYRIRL